MDVEVIEYLEAMHSGYLFSKILERLPNDVTLDNVDYYLEDIYIDLIDEDSAYTTDIELDLDEYEDMLPGGYSRALPGDGIER